MAAARFSPKVFTFLKDLKRNNDRTWFEANKSRYESDVLEPALNFVEEFSTHLRKISPSFVASARRSGGSLFRIHRDVRFSKDKSPYKTHLGIQFRHKNAKDVHAPGFYLHIEPAGCFAGAGIWRPDSAATSKIRSAIDEHPASWKKAAHGKPFIDSYDLAGESLVRVPSGFAKDHPLAGDLKRKDFIGVASLSDRSVTSPGFLAEYAALGRDARGFMRFLCEAVGVES